MSQLTLQIQSIANAIQDISQLHQNQSEKWLQDNSDAINLKKTLLRDICSYDQSDSAETISFSADFIKLMNKYCNDLNNIYLSPFYDFIEWDFENTNRIKDPVSRLAKIIHYVSGKNEGGKVSIKKCLNDLFGFRIFVQDFNHTEENYILIRDQILMPNVKITNSSKSGYLATHVYFSNGNNKCFPWELQLWNLSDVDSNFRSHSIHKQGYTKWVSVFKEAEIVGRRLNG
ncbi:hypothetical protein [Paenisporosarcina sp.]|uniref:hypothetical protein n=1 Tax=Paenisporosarcina sp. TaxID=1932001 RepID=UPI003C76AE36